MKRRTLLNMLKALVATPLLPAATVAPGVYTRAQFKEARRKLEQKFPPFSPVGIWAGLLDPCQREIRGAGYERVPLREYQINPEQTEIRFGEIRFPQAADHWGLVQYIALFRQPQGGPAFYFTALHVSKEIQTYDSVLAELEALQNDRGGFTIAGLMQFLGIDV